MSKDNVQKNIERNMYKISYAAIAYCLGNSKRFGKFLNTNLNGKAMDKKERDIVKQMCVNTLEAMDATIQELTKEIGDGQEES